jgi:hypothetical protein
MKKLLSDFRANTYSQFGEDGIIAAIFERMPPRTRICVEFGAWDGFHLANTARLFAKESWRAYLIEGDPERFVHLTENVAEFDCVCVNAWVMPEGPQSLEAILESHGLLEQPDLVSIDIDGDDYYVLEGLARLRPQLILCEYNPTIPPTLDLYAPVGTSFGCSASALVRIAQTKGYELVAMTDTNCFFVPQDQFHLFDEFETHPEVLYSSQYLTYLATGYAGQYVVINKGPYGLVSRFPQRLSGRDAEAIIAAPWDSSPIRPLDGLRSWLSRRSRRGKT